MLKNKAFDAWKAFQHEKIIPQHGGEIQNVGRFIRSRPDTRTEIQPWLLEHHAWGPAQRCSR